MTYKFIIFALQIESKEHKVSELQSILKSDLFKGNTIGIDVDSNGCVTVLMTKKGEVYEATNHIGQLQELDKELFTKYIELVSFIFKNLNKKSVENKQQNYESYFTVKKFQNF